MARRRGFFAELQHQAAVAERNRQRQAAANYRAFQQQQRNAERLAAAARRARDQAARADARAQAAAEKEAQRLYAEARAAEAEAMTAEAEVVLKEIDDILLATLEVDDFVDLEMLRTVAEHPPFESPHATAPAPPTPRAQAALPAYLGPSGTGKRTGRRAEESARADRAFMAALYAWWDEAFAIQGEHTAALQRHATDEEARLSRLAADRETYEQDCRRRDADEARRNSDLDDLIRRFTANEPAAVLAAKKAKHLLTNYMISRAIYWGTDAYFPHDVATDVGYEFTMWEYLCSSAGCSRGTNWVNIRYLVNWYDGKKNHGTLRTMYCHHFDKCPSWTRTDLPYLGLPGPKMTGEPPLAHTS